MNVIPFVKESKGFNMNERECKECKGLSKQDKVGLGVILGVLLIGWCWNIFSLWL